MALHACLISISVPCSYTWRGVFLLPRAHAWLLPLSSLFAGLTDLVVVIRWCASSMV
jgi:hypothetical protein